jgi:uncharacterized repeat protein (TIGR03803 family)
MIRSLNIFGILGVGLTLALCTPLTCARAADVTILYAFKGHDRGAGPSTGVIRDSQGNLYGTTWEGGGKGCEGYGCGTVFKVAPNGTGTQLYAFKGGSDGFWPEGVVRDKAGNLYGTTQVGGGQGCAGEGCGTVFELTPDGTETVLHAFKGGSDGAYPWATVYRDDAGNLYGTTAQGGEGCNNRGCGTVFKIAPDGTKSVLYDFCSQNNCADGGGSTAPLIADKVGNLYGTTQGGGAYNNGGTVFKLTKSGVETVLYSFCQQQNCPDGSNPFGGLAMDKAGNLYGTTEYGGNAEWSGGVVFKLAPDGTETVLHAFSLDVDGVHPWAGVIVDKEGDVYGTLTSSGVCTQSKVGLVYRISPDGSEKLSCPPGLTYGGVIEAHGTLYGSGGGGSEKYPAGFVFAIGK